MFDTNLILKSNTDDQFAYHVPFWARVSTSLDPWSRRGPMIDRGWNLAPTPLVQLVPGSLFWAVSENCTQSSLQNSITHYYCERFIDYGTTAGF